MRIDAAVRRRRRRRHHHATGGRQARREARPAFRGREQCGRRRHRRRARGAAVAGRRLYACGADQRHRGQRRAVQEPAVRSDQGFRAGLGDGLFRPRARDQCQRALQDARRFHQGGEGKARPAQCRHHRRGLEPESRRRIVQVGFGPGFRDRAVQDLGRGAGRSGAQRRADGGRVLCRAPWRARCQEIHSGRDLGHQARRISARCSDREGGRRAEVGGHVLERDLRARRHAAGCRRDA